MRSDSQHILGAYLKLNPSLLSGWIAMLVRFLQPFVIDASKLLLEA